MKNTHWLGMVAVFSLGIAVGLAAKVPTASPALFSGKAPREAALALLGVAEAQAEKGSWENIGVARVYYLMGEKTKANAMLERVSAGKMKGDDWLRLGRLYEEAGEWEKARDAFEKALALEPKDEDYPAEIGAFYNLHGDRARAEELFKKSFELKGDEVWNTINAAGSFVGVRPQ